MRVVVGEPDILLAMYLSSFIHMHAAATGFCGSSNGLNEVRVYVNGWTTSLFSLIIASME